MMQRTYTNPTRTRPQRQKGAGTYIIVIVLLVAAILLGVFFVVTHKDKKDAAKPGSTTKSQAGQQSTTKMPRFDKTTYSTADPASIWVVVNKQHALNPKNYTPADLVFPNVPLRVPGNESMQMRKVAATALEQLVAGAKTDGLSLMLSSGYRSYSYQVNLYGGYVNSMGQAEADKTSARPGFSEHQTGLAVDVEPASKKCEVEACFGDTAEGQWVAANAYKYGFIVRYTADKVAITGYSPEPWHLRYVGTELAGELHKQSITTLEEFFGISGGEKY